MTYTHDADVASRTIPGLMLALVLTLTMTTGCDTSGGTPPPEASVAFFEGEVRPAVNEPRYRPIAEVRLAEIPCDEVTDSTLVLRQTQGVDTEGAFQFQITAGTSTTYRCIQVRARPSPDDPRWTAYREVPQSVTFRFEAPYETVDVGTVQLPDSLTTS